MSYRSFRESPCMSTHRQSLSYRPSPLWQMDWLRWSQPTLASSSAYPATEHASFVSRLSASIPEIAAVIPELSPLPTSRL